MPAYVLPDLPYDEGALEPAITGAIMALHHGRHHLAHVKGANEALDRLEEARQLGEYRQVAGLQKALAFNLSGHVLHSQFWQNLCPDGGGRPDGLLADALDEHFGSFDRFRQQLTAATTTIQGSGWGVLTWEPIGRRLLVEQVYDHHGNVTAGGTPILVFDAWEHAYYLQYKDMRPDYVDRLWDLVNWPDVAARLAAARF